MAKRAGAEIDAGEFEVVLGNGTKLLVGEIGAVAVGDESAVGEEVGAHGTGFEVLGQAVLSQATDSALRHVVGRESEG